ncbi:transmembrane protein, putative (macronuclear) [Tetrahymena thermophila SB210]|uniref:Transmembrane protein, putative n=1 Tax=Tetrahymena thermophila (strain SB210) TaxID=312017 RepID=I7LVZ9_TETTS|nr:transmembrane protein, putative [Tetrahymena thermophila SB210]EAS00419.2 transmembrane protein, putative [Tetrahymena thermophila SB210]|eukprot:XP_001020664.2 transmembrane protein, putative [Tetrahymena thermophila SB210]
MKISLLNYVLIAMIALQSIVYCSTDDQSRLSKLQIKFGSPTTITFLYQQTFRTEFQENTYKENITPSFCSIKQSSFTASEAQQINISDLCYTNCLFQAQDYYAYIVNEKSQFIVFQMQEEGTNQNYKIPYFSRKLITRNQIDEDLQKLQNLSKAKLILNQNNTLKQASLITQYKFYWYQSGTIQTSQFNFSSFDDQSLSKIIIQDQYLIIPDDSTGIQIYSYSSISPSNNYSLQPHLNITISQFFKLQEWQRIQDMINKQDNNSNIDPNNGQTSNGQDIFEFNFSIKSLQVKLVQTQTINIFAYEQFSKAICIFSVDLLNKSALLIQKVPTAGKISNFLINNNFLYANQAISKGIRDNFSLVEFQQITSQGNYIPRQTYPMTSNISKILVSETLSYSLQENIISIVRRQVPFKLNSEEETKQQISIQYSEGADDFWNFPAKFTQNQSSPVRGSGSSQDTINESTKYLDQDSDDSSGSYFSPRLSLQDNDSLLNPVDSILVKNQDSLSIIIIQEKLSHLICQPEDEKVLNKEYTFFMSLEVFSSKDSSGNIQLQTYSEGLDITIFRDIFQNSTVALVVGLSVGLTLSLIVVIIFCIYFYRMKNHYQLLLQDNSKDLSKEVASSSINTSSNNSSNESYPSSVNMQSNQTEEQQNNQANIFKSNKNNFQKNNSKKYNNNNQQIQLPVLDDNNIIFNAQNANSNDGNYHFQSDQHANEFYINSYQIQNQNQKYIIPNNTQMQDLPNQEFTGIRNPEQDISQKFPSCELDCSSSSGNNDIKNVENDNTNGNHSKSSDKIKNIQKSQNIKAPNSQQIVEDELNSNNSNKSEHVSFRNNSIEEQESQNNSNSDKSSKGPCAQSQISKEMIGYDIVSFKSQTSDQLRQSQTIYNSPLKPNNLENDNSIEFKLKQNQIQFAEKRD